MPSSCEKLPGAGSNRQYFRLMDEDGKSVIGCTGTSCEENEAFIYLTQHFAGAGLPVPEIFAISDDRLSYIQTDLGTSSLYDALKEGREGALGYTASDIILLQKTIHLLPKIQVVGAEGLDFSRCYPLESMDEQSIMFDLNYFKYCFLKTSGIEFNEVKLEKCFKALVSLLQEDTAECFMYRDFQARNVMLSDGKEPYFIDYQGGRKGPLQYDLISFLWQASSHYTSEIRQFLIDEYITSLKEYKDIDEDAFRRSIPKWVLFRTLQVLGAYGFRGKIEGKKYFLDSIPSAIQNLREVLEEVDLEGIAYLHEILTQLVNLPAYNINKVKEATSPKKSQEEDKKLTVRVFSFSYKKGIPEDTSGNGGGYVFDCRSTHNPGRYEPYKKLTGLDKPVIDFLENDGEIIDFLESVYKLADAHVARYIERGFTSLMFSFGCTGGQHRSVYSAQHLAEYISDKFGVEVVLTHREQGIKRVFPRRKKAMIFAAGLGTRLKPLTDTMPKALVPIKNKPLIEHVIDKLVLNGINDFVVNVHHFAEMIEDWAEKALKTSYKDKGIRISFSDERNELLETGGGIKNAQTLLQKSNPDAKILIHNVDILSNVDINRFWDYGNDADAVLVVSKRDTSRYLVFDDCMKLVGWTNIHTGEVKTPHKYVEQLLQQREEGKLDVGNIHLRAFDGIHQLKTNLIAEMDSWPARFSIIDFYLNICTKANIFAYTQDNHKIVDVGKLNTLSVAEEFCSSME